MIQMIYAAALGGLMILLLAFPQAASQGAIQALELCVHQLIPALFPFFVVSSLLVRLPAWSKAAGFLCPLTRSIGIASPQAPLILILSWLGGYGVSAQSIRDGIRQGSLTPEEGARLLVLGCTSSPGFTIGSVGALMLGSPFLGRLLFVAGLGANLATCLLLRLFLGKAKSSTTILKPSSDALDVSSAITTGVTSCLSVCGSVIFFRVLWQLAQELFSLSPTGQAILGSLLEVTSGCSLMAALPWPEGCCAALSLLGGSVFLQIAGLAQGSCSVRLLLLTRPVHLLFSLTFFRIGMHLFPSASQVYSSFAPRLILTSRNPPDLAFWLFLLACLALKTLSGGKRKKSS